MTDSEQLAFLLRVLRLFGGWNGLSLDGLFWEFDPLIIAVNCNDLFWWAAADAEDLTPENFGEMEKAHADCIKAFLEGGAIHSCSLFACRVRKMRPQSPCYKSIPAELHPLFDACGPVRDKKDEG